MGDYIRNNPAMPWVLLVLLFNCLRLVGMVMFFFDKRTDKLVRGFIFVLLAYFAIAAGPIANTRYFLPVSLMAAGCAVMGYMRVLQKRKTV